MPNSPKPNPGASDANVDRAALLREAVEHSVRAQQEAARPVVIKRSRARTVTAATLCAGLLALCAWSLITRPEFIWGPRPGAISPQKAEASTRLAMFIIAQKLDEFRDAESVYPTSLAAVDLADSSIAYTRVADTIFALRSQVAGMMLELRSTDNFGAFVRSTALTPGKH